MVIIKENNFVIHDNLLWLDNSKIFNPLLNHLNKLKKISILHTIPRRKTTSETPIIRNLIQFGKLTWQMLHSLSIWCFDVSSQNWSLAFLMFRPISSSLSPVFTWPILSPSSSNCYQTQTACIDQHKTMSTDNILIAWKITNLIWHVINIKSPVSKLIMWI